MKRETALAAAQRLRARAASLQPSNPITAGTLDDAAATLEKIARLRQATLRRSNTKRLAQRLSRESLHWEKENRPEISRELQAGAEQVDRAAGKKRTNQHG